MFEYKFILYSNQHSFLWLCIRSIVFGRFCTIFSTNFFYNIVILYFVLIIVLTNFIILVQISIVIVCALFVIFLVYVNEGLLHKPKRRKNSYSGCFNQFHTIIFQRQLWKNPIAINFSGSLKTISKAPCIIHHWRNSSQPSPCLHCIEWCKISL